MGIGWKHAIVRVVEDDRAPDAAERAVLERFDHGWLLVGEEQCDEPGSRDFVFRHASISTTPPPGP